MLDDAFAQPLLAQDLTVIGQILQAFFAGRSDKDWEQETELGGWTLRQTAVHLGVVASAYMQFIQAGLVDLPVTDKSFQSRTDLPAWNERMIAEQIDLPITAVIESFLTTLQECATLATTLSEEQLAKTVQVPAYGNALNLAELLGAQAAHPGLIHAAQLPNALNFPPLWHSYPTDLWQRQLTRTFCLMAASYWPERGGNLDTAVNFVIRGHTRMSWYVTMSPQGSNYGTGSAEKASLTLSFRSLDTVSRSLTGQLSPYRGLLTGQIFAWGNPFLGLRLPRLFNPTA